MSVKLALCLAVYCVMTGYIVNVDYSGTTKMETSTRPYW